MQALVPETTALRDPSKVAAGLAITHKISNDRAVWHITAFIKDGYVTLWQFHEGFAGRPGTWIKVDDGLTARRTFDVANDRFERETAPTVGGSHEVALTKQVSPDPAEQPKEAQEHTKFLESQIDFDQARDLQPIRYGIRRHEVDEAYARFAAAHKNLGGRPTEYDWRAIMLAALSKIEDERWRPKNQAEIVRFLLEWAYEHHQKEPQESQCDPVAKRLYGVVKAIVQREG